MIFLAFNFFKPSTWLSSVDNGIMGAITTGLRTLMFWLDTFIYNLIINLYDFFNKLCTARLLDDTALNAISQRVGLILGLVMFFSVVFSFIQMMIDPEKMSDKEKGAFSIIKRALLVIVMLGASNFAFQSLYKMQNLIIQENVISKLILPYQINDNDINNFGNILSKELIGSFYQMDTFDDVVIDDSNESNKKDNCTAMRVFFLEEIEKKGKFDLGYTCLNESIKVSLPPSSASVSGYSDERYMVNFNGIMSVIAGVIVAYVLFMYCFGVGLRMVQLAFLEIISPMAIVSYLSPKKDNMFGKWWKIYFSTYIDVFLRIAIINFVVFLIMTLFASNNAGQFIFWETLGNPNGAERSFLMVVIIIALLTFAKKAPDLLKELFPAGASKLGLGVSMKDYVGLQKGAKIGSSILGGAVGGAAMGTIGILSGRGLGWATGALKGGLSGLKGQGFGKTMSAAWKDQSKMNKTIANVRRNGGSALGYHMAQLQRNLNMSTASDIDEGKISSLESLSKIRDQVEARADNNKVIKALKKRYETIQQAGQLENETADQYNARVRAAEKQWKDARKSMVTAAMSGKTEFEGYKLNTDGTFAFDSSGNLVKINNAEVTSQEIQFMDALKNQANRIISSDSSLFNGYAPVKSYDNLDDNVNAANDEIIKIKSTEEYAKNKANSSGN